MEFEEEYLLRDLYKAGIFPSPYNYVGIEERSLDELAIHDSTLREGEQTPGVIFRVEEKLRIAERLDEVGIKRLECGFPAASEKQRASVKAIAGLDLDAQIVAFARAKENDIDAVADTGAEGIIVCFSVSHFHRESKFQGMTQEAYLEKLGDSIGYAKSRGLHVIYSGEDTSREADLGFLKRAYMAAEAAGADRARVIDTLGCLNPNGAAYLIGEIKQVVGIPLEVHFHNDLGLALANSIAAIEAGASAISTCVNGLGERAGITATEEAIAALRILFGVDCFEVGKLTDLSNFIEEITGVKTPPQKPITGANVCTHSSGIHQHGVLKNPVTYEFYPHDLFGRWRRMELDELSGRHGVIYVARTELGIDLSEKVARNVLSRIKESFSNEGRQSPYTLDELRSLIQELKED